MEVSRNATPQNDLDVAKTAFGEEAEPPGPEEGAAGGAGVAPATGPPPGAEEEGNEGPGEGEGEIAKTCQYDLFRCKELPKEKSGIAKGLDKAKAMLTGGMGGVKGGLMGGMKTLTPGANPAGALAAATSVPGASMLGNPMGFGSGMLKKAVMMELGRTSTSSEDSIETGKHASFVKDLNSPPREDPDPLRALNRRLKLLHRTMTNVQKRGYDHGDVNTEFIRGSVLTRAPPMHKKPRTTSMPATTGFEEVKIAQETTALPPTHKVNEWDESQEFRQDIEEDKPPADFLPTQKLVSSDNEHVDHESHVYVRRGPMGSHTPHAVQFVPILHVVDPTALHATCGFGSHRAAEDDHYSSLHTAALYPSALEVPGGHDPKSLLIGVLGQLLAM